MKIPFNRKTWIPLFLLLVITTSFTLGSWATSKTADRDNVLRDLDLFAKVVEKIKSYYVDDVDTHELIQQAIESMLKELDPHSQFLSGLDYEDLMLSTQGQFGGLGIFISFRDNYPTVISPIDGTPADRVGLQGGDQIVEIEGESSEGWQVQKAVRYLRGEPGTSVRFKISRPGLNEPIEYNLVRERIEVSSIPYYGVLDGYGYVKISNFSKSTRDELESALVDLHDQNVKGIVVDLRSNPGGLLQAATGVSELFLDKDKLVVYTKGRYAQNNHKYYAGKSRKFNDRPIVVMINGASASASEIVAGAVQDWDAGFVVGQTSFGKGTVQTVFNLTDEEAVKLTTAKYYTPSGRSIHKDHGKVQDDELAADAGEEGLDAPISITETEKSAEVEEQRPVYQTSGGRTVYGGGGITPDLVFEPRTFNELERRLERDALFFTFAVEYSTNHNITKDFKVTDDVLNAFKKLLADRGFEYKEEEMTGDSLDYVKKAIIREVISKNFGRKEMYSVMLWYDPEFTQVLDIMKASPTLAEMYRYAEQQNAMKKASLK